MKNLLAIRPAVPGDEGLLLALIRELAEYERMLDEVEATETNLADSLFHRFSHCTLVKQGIDKIGFGGLHLIKHALVHCQLPDHSQPQYLANPHTRTNSKQITHVR